MIPIYILEDEAIIREHIQEVIEKHIMIENYDMDVICATALPESILEIEAQENVRGLYFLDVDLGPDTMTGFELAKIIRERDPRGYLVFITTHDELLMETFKMRLEAMDYILKDDLEQVGGRIRNCIDVTIDRVLKEQMEIGEYYTIKIFDDVYHIPVSEILYFETSQEKHRIIMHANRDLLDFVGNLSKIDLDLGKTFVRIHRSYVVNRQRIKRIDYGKSEIELDNGEMIPMSRKGRKTLEG